jgi:Pirin C-terminal cupin domain
MKAMRVCTGMKGLRYICWNFVSSSKERIEHAKNDWKSIPGETEFIPCLSNDGLPISAERWS